MDAGFKIALDSAGLSSLGWRAGGFILGGAWRRSSAAQENISGLLGAWSDSPMTDHLSVLEEFLLLTTLAYESGGFTKLEENLNYKPSAIRRTWPTRFTQQEAFDLGRRNGKPADKEMIANIAYGSRMGNKGIESGDGWLYRGRGFIQVTGRANYYALGFAENPDALLQPYTAGKASLQWWERNVRPALSAEHSTTARTVFEAAQEAVGLGSGRPQELLRVVTRIVVGSDITYADRLGFARGLMQTGAAATD